MRRILTVCLIATAMIATAIAPVIAGGWAVTTIVDMPDRFVAGETHEVAFEIRQHGRTLITEFEAASGVAAEVAVVLERVDGPEERLVFPAENVGTRWVAQVETPNEGDWTWSVGQGWFAPYELGDLPLQRQAGASGPQLTGAALGIALLAMGAVLMLVRRGDQRQHATA